jgi:MFS family permease
LNIVALLIVGLGASIAPLDFSVNVALPAISRAFDLDTQEIRWIPLGYVFTYGLLVIGFGALGDRVGHLRVFRLGLILGVIALTLCATAQSYPWLIGARVLQGVAMGLTLSCAPALVTFLYQEHERTLALSMYGSMTSVASLVAPLAGGFSILLLGWSGVYWFRVPLAILALIFLPMVSKQLIQPRIPRKSTTTDASTISLLLKTFKDSRSFVWVNITSIAVQMASFTIPLLTPYYFSRVAQWQTAEIGAALAIWASGTLLGSALAAKIAVRIGTNRTAFVASFLCALALLLTSFWSSQIPLALIGSAMFIQGTGLGLFQVSYSDWVVRMLPKHARGVAGGLIVFTRTIGVVSAAVIWLWMLDHLQTTANEKSLAADAAFLSGFQTVSFLSASLIVTALIVSGLASKLWFSNQRQSNQ